jgi:ADP-ribose pyrophosphatase YjhB (NUDIX family)
MRSCPFIFPEGDVSHIHPPAICLSHRYGKILLFEGYDAAKGETFYRPLGGGIEFGEHSTDAIRRETGEEIDAEVKKSVYPGTLENIFTNNGSPAHEVVQVYAGVLAGAGLYEQAVQPGYEDDMSERIEIFCKRLDEFGPGKSMLYPDGLLELAGQ